MKQIFNFFYFLLRYRSIVFGRIEIGANCVVRYNLIFGSVILDDDCILSRCEIHGEVEIGEGTSLNGPGIFIHAGRNKIKIGRYCSIAPFVRFITSGHSYNNGISSFKRGAVSRDDPISLEDDIWIGANSIVLGGVVIPSNCVFGAGSVIDKRTVINPFCLYAPVRSFYEKMLS